MPLALSPSANFEVILESDQKVAAETRPTFIYRYLTGQQWREVGIVQDKLEDAKGAIDIVDLVYSAAAVGLIGWRNMIDPAKGPIEFDPEKLDQVIGITEAQELIFQVISQGMPTADLKKKLG